MELTDLNDFPYSGTKRAFSWVFEEPDPGQTPRFTLTSSNEDEAFADLKLCMYLYLIHRKEMYVNYMIGAKNLFSIFFLPNNPLKEQCPLWSEAHTEWLSYRHDAHSTDWTPEYEIQRMWLATKVHWSWLELAWYECEAKLWESGQAWMREKLERVSPTKELES